jgi:hypothetical protein
MTKETVACLFVIASVMIIYLSGGLDEWIKATSPEEERRKEAYNERLKERSFEESCRKATRKAQRAETFQTGCLLITVLAGFVFILYLLKHLWAAL